jgi:hypothetical protein
MNDPAPAPGREKSLPLAGKVAVVTGGSNGIGVATVRLLANEGASVVVGFNKGARRRLDIGSSKDDVTHPSTEVIVVCPRPRRSAIPIPKSQGRFRPRVRVYGVRRR